MHMAPVAQSVPPEDTQDPRINGNFLITMHARWQLCAHEGNQRGLFDCLINHAYANNRHKITALVLRMPSLAGFQYIRHIWTHVHAGMPLSIYKLTITSRGTLWLSKLWQSTTWTSPAKLSADIATMRTDASSRGSVSLIVCRSYCNKAALEDHSLHTRGSVRRPRCSEEGFCRVDTSMRY